MTKRIYSRGVAKYIRKEKANIRRRVRDSQEQDKLIKEFLSKIQKKNK